MADQKKVFQLRIEPEGVEVTVSSGSKLTAALKNSGFPIVLPCGGNGSCGKCTVKFLSGAPEPEYEETLFLSGKQLENGIRLACISHVVSDAEVSIDEIREVSGEQILAAGRSHQIKPDPVVSKKVIKISPASPQDLKCDEQIILGDVENAAIENVEILRHLPQMINQGAQEATVTLYGPVVLSAEVGDTGKKLYGIALDLGTTTIVFSIIDLIHGKTEFLHAGPNPQRQHGDDLISRLTYVGSGKTHLRNLSTGVIGYLNQMIQDGCKKLEISPHDIFMLTVSGNTVMNHIFLGVNPSRIGHAPYTPVFKNARSFTAEQLELAIHPQAPVFIAPNIGGFVGGDIISDMLVAGFGKRHKKIRLLIDIGTNCEVVLEHDSRVWAASSPAGPALEGACITSGMRAAPGAILDARFTDDQLHLQTIGDQIPRGICGSGLFHLVDIFYQKDLIDPSGRLRQTQDIKQESARALVTKFINEGSHNNRSIRVSDGIFLTQNDIREFQLAKAAIASAWQYLCETAGCLPADIDAVYIAGAFGNYIRPQAAINLGLIPAIDLQHVHFIGNASLEGARMMLLNRKYQRAADRLARMTNFIELAGRPEFQDLYVENMRLGILKEKGNSQSSRQ